MLTLLLAATLFGAPDADAKALAKQHFKQGETEYKLGRFDSALAAFSAAYEALPLPAFLFNIGQCHRQTGNHERAVFFFEGYLREIPDAKNKRVVEELLAESRAELARQEQERAAQGEQKAREEELSRREMELAQAEEAARTRIATLPDGSLPIVEEPLWGRWWFWAAVGGVLLAGAAVTVALIPAEQPPAPPPGGSVGTLDRRALR